MKTTLDLPDDLMRAVKIRAAEHNLKLKDIVADALRAALASPAEAASQVAGQPAPLSVVPAAGKLTPASAAAGQRRLRYAALLAQLDQMPDLPHAMDPLAWDDLGLPS